MITKWDGSKNSVEIRHEQAEKIKERMENTEAGDECESCGYTSVEITRLCLAHGDEVTPYCCFTGKPGCLWKRTGVCQGSRIVGVCVDCGKVQAGQ